MVNKRAQEEMIGFVLIVILVAVIILVFLGFSLNSPNDNGVESYEVSSFIQSFLQYTTDCAEDYEPEYYSVKELIVACDKKRACLDERDSCDVLNETLIGILDSGWRVGEERPVKGYKLEIVSGEREIFEIVEGNATREYKSSVQDFSYGGDLIKVFFSAYY